MLLPGLLAGPELRENANDLQPVYRLLDDFLFLGALRDCCFMEWADEMLKVGGQEKLGWVIRDKRTEGPLLQIRMARPTSEIPLLVHTLLWVLMHEMCHALLYLACECSICCCELHMMDGWGITGHGPSWQRLRASVEETVNLNLKGFSEPFSLSHPTEPELRSEAEARERFLKGMSKKFATKHNKVDQEKRAARNTKRERTQYIHQITTRLIGNSMRH